MTHRYQLTLIFSRKVTGYCLTYVEGFKAETLGKALQYADKRARLKKWRGSVSLYVLHDDDVGGLAKVGMLHL